ncbi:MAG: hypothetical protein D6790_02950, partial [Caldilineae bacterium]
ILGFLLLSGLFVMITEGAYSDQARLVSLMGFVTWQVADGCMVRIARSFAEDAQWGTLEQVWLSAAHPSSVVIARSFVNLSLNALKAAVTAIAVLAVFRLSLSMNWAALWVFLLAQVGVFGMAFAIIGLHLVYKSVESVTLVLSTLLLFVTGALTPLDSAPRLALVGRFLPLGQGVAMLQDMVVTPISVLDLLAQPQFYWLLVHTGGYLAIGWLVFMWGQGAAQERGALGHY